MSVRVRRSWLFWSLVSMQLALFLGWQLTHLGGFQWGRDEGIYMMRVRLLQDGHRLYRDVWTDQLPGMIELLWAVFFLLSPSVELARAVVVVLTAVGLLSTAALAWQLGGRGSALAVVPMLALAPNIFWLSRAVISPDLPSTSLGIAGLALMGRFALTKHRRWLVLSGLALAAGLYIKATALLLAVPAVFWLLTNWWRSPGRKVSGLLERATLWGAVVMLPLAVALALHDLPAFWDQFVATQVASGQAALKIGPHALKVLSYLGEHNWGLALLAMAGAAISLRRRSGTADILLVWLAACLIVLLLRSPLWPSHHLVVLLPPLAVLAGQGLSAFVSALDRRRIGYDVIWLAAGALAYAASLPGIVRADSGMLVAPTSQSSLEAVDFLQDHLSPGALVVSDYHMIPFRAGCRIPPELATVSKKRIESGLLDTHELMRIIEQSQPEAVLLWDDQLLRSSEYEEWLRVDYVLGFKRAYHEIYMPLAADAIQHSQEVQLGQALRLRGYSLSPLAEDPGGALDVTLYWQVFAPIEDRYHGFVHLLTLTGDMISQKDQLAWGEHYPSSDWHVGETILDRYSLAVPDDAAPGSYVLSVGLYDGETHERLPVQDVQGGWLDGDQIALGVRPVVRGPAQYQAPQMEHHVGARFGNLAQLSGYSLAHTPTALEVTLVWEALAASDWPGYTVFVHLGDDAGLVTQHDGVPRQGQQPTIGWRGGEYITDSHLLALGDVPEGRYSLTVGMYDPHTGERIPVFDASGLPAALRQVSLDRVAVRKAD